MTNGLTIIFTAVLTLVGVACLGMGVDVLSTVSGTFDKMFLTTMSVAVAVLAFGLAWAIWQEDL